MFLWHREVPEAWQAALDAVCPAGDKLSRFLIVWEPGEPQAPIQRWTIWQMRPPEVTRRMLARKYQGRVIDPRVMGLADYHPRRGARWDDRAKCYRRHDGSLAMTDRLTWELYHRTGSWGTRWWVIQGPAGGHRYTLTHTEKKLLGTSSDGRERDVPFAGDLPYAPFDQRVVRHFAQMEAVATWHRVLAKAEVAAQHRVWDADEQHALEAARASLADWIDRQFGALWDDYSPVYKQALRQMPRRVTTREDRPTPGDNAEWRERFIAQGS